MSPTHKNKNQTNFKIWHALQQSFFVYNLLIKIGNDSIRAMVF